MGGWVGGWVGAWPGRLTGAWGSGAPIGRVLPGFVTPPPAACAWRLTPAACFVLRRCAASLYCSQHCLHVLPCPAESLDRNHLNFQTIRPADYPTPYAAMLKNNIQFSAMDRKAGRMSTLMVSPRVTMRLLGRRCRVPAAGGCGADAGGSSSAGCALHAG